MAWKNRVGKGAALLTGVVYGAGLMYLLDPEVGRRRRHEIRQELVHARNRARGWLRGEVQHQIHRARGVVAEWRARLRETDIPDEILEGRVRAQLGHVIAEAAKLDISCHHGGVTVRGPLLAGEREKVQQRLGRTRGVRYWSLEVREVPGPETRTA